MAVSVCIVAQHIAACKWYLLPRGRAANLRRLRASLFLYPIFLFFFWGT